MENPKMPGDSLNFLQKLSEQGVWNFFIILVLSGWAGTVRWLLNVKGGEKPTVIGWFIETFVSAFVGLLVAFACASYEVGFYMSAVIIAVAAHNGTRTLYLLTSIVKKSTIFNDNQLNK